MNKLVLQVCVILAFASLALSSPLVLRVDREEPEPILHSESYDTPNGHHFSYGTQNGINRDEDLTINNKGTEEEEIVIKGQYSYKGPDNLIYTVSYTADRNGYHATIVAPHVDGIVPAGLPGSNVLPRLPLAPAVPYRHHY